jgi:hypothetical protein
MKDMILWNGNISSGPQAVPGTYKARFIIQQDSVEKPFTILPTQLIKYLMQITKRNSIF